MNKKKWRKLNILLSASPTFISEGNIKNFNYNLHLKRIVFNSRKIKRKYRQRKFPRISYARPQQEHSVFLLKLNSSFAQCYHCTALHTAATSNARHLNNRWIQQLLFVEHKKSTHCEIFYEWRNSGFSCAIVSSPF